MRYFIIAGEASGDLHASYLMRELKVQDPHAEFCFFGGDLMLEQGGTLLKHYREMAFMGFLTVLLNLRQIKRNFRMAEAELLKFAPDVLILVDYPGFNFRMARFARKHAIRTFYYISPKIWAWGSSRVKWVLNYVDEMFTIFPFEKDFYDQYNYPIRYVGNPTVDELSGEIALQQSFQEFIQENGLKDQPIVAVLAGSRRQEVKLILPVLKEVAFHFPDYQFVIAGAPSLSLEFYQQVMGDTQLPVLSGKTYELIRQSRAALVASGTATLETAVLNIPQVVCYILELGRFASVLRSAFYKMKWFSLVNLIMEEEIVGEYFQEHCTSPALARELGRLLQDQDYREKMLENYRLMLNKLGPPGCSARAAEMMVNILRK